VSDPSTDEDDRRDDPRMPIELRVEYKKLNTFFADYTKNICKGGTFIRTQKPLDVGTIFLFQLAVPTLDKPIEIRGEVKWVKRDGEPSPPGVAEDHEAGMGIRFIYDKPDERRAVETTVERMMVDSLGQVAFEKLINSEK
jgi:type IV pilus assembly protein PilZ